MFFFDETVRAIRRDLQDVRRAMTPPKPPSIYECRRNLSKREEYAIEQAALSAHMRGTKTPEYWRGRAGYANLPYAGSPGENFIIPFHAFDNDSED